VGKMMDKLGNDWRRALVEHMVDNLQEVRHHMTTPLACDMHTRLPVAILHERRTRLCGSYRSLNGPLFCVMSSRCTTSSRAT
jgi:hypothetical protein